MPRVIGVGRVGLSAPLADEVAAFKKQNVEGIPPKLDLVFLQLILQKKIQLGYPASGQIGAYFLHQSDHQGLGHVLIFSLVLLFIPALTAFPKQAAIVPQRILGIHLPEHTHCLGPSFFRILILRLSSAKSISVSKAMFFIWASSNYLISA